MAEFEEEKQKKLACENIKAVRKIVHAEVLEKPPGRTGEALSLPHHQSSTQCFVAMDPSTSSLPWAIDMVVTLVFILVSSSSSMSL